MLNYKTNHKSLIHRLAGFSSVQFVLEFQKSVTKCSSCGLPLCDSDKCAVWDAKRKGWTCTACDAFYSKSPACDWLLERLNKRFEKLENNNSTSKHKTVAKSAGAPVPDRKRFDDVMLELNSKQVLAVKRRDLKLTMVHPISPSITDKSSPIPLEQRIKVREFVEDLLSSMLGGPLDEVSVGELFKHLECELIYQKLPFFSIL